MFKDFVLEVVLNDIISEVNLKALTKHDYEMQYAQLITELTTMVEPNTGTVPCITINEKVFGSALTSGFRMTSSKIYTWKAIEGIPSITVYVNNGFEQQLLDFGYTDEEIKYLKKIIKVLKDNEIGF
jgi:hypothetical protein